MKAMEELALNSDLRREMSANALAKADTLRPDKVVKQWLFLIKTIVGDR